MEKISENQNIHNMMKYNQPVGRLRDRAPSLLAGRFEFERRRYIMTKVMTWRKSGTNTQDGLSTVVIHKLLSLF